jgi:hypothetical protein
MRKDVKRILRQAEQAGCEVYRGGSGHWKVRCPGGRVTVSSSPSSRHAIREIRKDFARAGVAVNPPMSTWAKVGIGVGVGLGVLLLGAGVAYARATPKPISAPIPTEDEAIAEAVGQLGEDASTRDIASLAYYMAYPEGDTPPTGAFLMAWNRIVWKVNAVLGRAEQEVTAPTTPPDVDDTSELVSAWLDSLDAQQLDTVRQVMGPSVVSPLEEAARRGDDYATRAALQGVKDGIEQQAKGSLADKAAALASYRELQSSLGPKLEEFEAIMEQTVGKPEVL